MEINKLNSISETASKLRDSGSHRDNAATGKPSPGSESRGGDSAVVLSGAGKVLAESLAKLNANDDLDSDRVSAIKNAIEQGTYHVNPERLANNFVELEAQLFG